jgi:hypothetical protein
VTAVVLRGDAAALPLPDACVDLVVTSPPYFGLRDYTDGGGSLAGQVGGEPTPGQYLDALIACTVEWMRALKPGGSIFVNLGDAYASASEGFARGNRDGIKQPRVRPRTGVKPKSLVGLPWRYAIRCIDELGLILRAEIVWAKPNGLPESVTDRVRRSHEQVFHFVKQPRYFSAVDEVRESYEGKPQRRLTEQPQVGEYAGRNKQTLKGRVWDEPLAGSNPLGKLPGSVWEIPTAPLTVPDHLGVDHFAAYPPELVRRIVAGWSPREVCTACGEGRRPVAVQSNEAYAAARRAVKLSTPRDKMMGGGRGTGAGAASDISNGVVKPEYTITGHACACPDTSAPATPGVVLDPFGGTGTTALVASVFGRVGISVDLSADYCRLATWRTQDPGERARALDVPKPAVPVDGQLGLFEALG